MTLTFNDLDLHIDHDHVYSSDILEHSYWQRNSPKLYKFYCCDLELDPMTLILKLDPDIMKMYCHTKNEVSRSRHSKVIAQTDRQTDEQMDTQTDMTENITFPHTRPVKIPGLQSGGGGSMKAKKTIDLVPS